MLKVLIPAVLLLALWLGGCSSPQAIDPTDGGALIKEMLLEQTPGCATCHSLEPGVTLVGPSLAGVAQRAETVLQDPAYTGSAVTSADYLRESILYPNVYVPEGFVKGTMYQDYSDHLSEEQVKALVDYMLTLK